MTGPIPAPSTAPPKGPLRLLVTGASGNVGTALLRALAAGNPDHVITGVVRCTPPVVAPYDGVAWHELDLAGLNVVEALTPLMAGVDAVVHLAWGFQPSRDVDYLRRTAVSGTQDPGGGAGGGAASGAYVLGGGVLAGGGPLPGG
jgi:UDP-glucose 4-epimerase